MLFYFLKIIFSFAIFIFGKFRFSDRQRDRQRNRQRDKDTDRKTKRHTDRQRQTDIIKGESVPPCLLP